MHKRGMPRFSVENFSSHSTGKLRRGTILCFRNFLVSNKLMDKRGGTVKIFYRKFFVAQCRKTCKRNQSVLCFRSFPVAKKFMDKWGKGGSFTFFCRRFSVSHCQKITYGNNLLLHYFWAIGEKGIREGRVSRLHRQISFFSQYQKNS